MEDLTKTICKLSNWKALGAERIQNFWIKKLHAAHQSMLNIFNNLCQNPTFMPTWLTKGITILIHKKDNETNAINDRPITCLPTSYKLLTLLVPTPNSHPQ